MTDFARAIIDSRRCLAHDWSGEPVRHAEEEGGCGVTGFACSIPVRSRHIYEPSVQMRNRGNGKGGGIAAVGLTPEQLGVSREVLTDDYLLQIALLQPEVRAQLEADLVTPAFDVHHAEALEHIDDFRDIAGLEVRPPEVRRYFVRVKPEVLRRFALERGLTELPERDIEDEFVYQNSFRLNSRYYASLGDKAAFVLSHGRDMLILKIVGYAEQIVQYYGLQDLQAHVWIAHQRYPTRGRVWHPGGAHPFCGLNDALVHNGDFANYHSVTEYLAQRNIVPLFLTDTEVSIQVFDLWNRVYRYPLEYIIEALAPTVEHDFDMLPPEKQALYRRIQASHIHGSPDGPWFFIIARNDAENDRFQLLGITDTAMLRPQVFALQEGEVQIGLICSEKQAIDATLRSLAEEDNRFCPIADAYWNARGGSHTDGGAFVFTVARNGNGERHLTCADKFGRRREVRPGARVDLSTPVPAGATGGSMTASLLADATGTALYESAKAAAQSEGLAALRQLCSELNNRVESDDERTSAINGLTLLLDRPYATGDNRTSSVLHLLSDCLSALFDSIPPLGNASASGYARIDWGTRAALRPPAGSEQVMVVDARGFPHEGDDCDARLIARAHEMGWRRFIGYRYCGQRFLACGLGPGSGEATIDAYGSTGDYLASGLDGATVTVHGNAQDQVAQIMKSGRLVVHGDVGQTFMYGAKGGSVFVKGNAAGRPLINAVGKPKAVINGTCLDFLAESFMAGDPLNGGGFVILNGVQVDDQGTIFDLDTPYPGSNLFSLASGGAIYVRDPHRLLDDEQLNGGEFRDLSDADWQLIRPYLDENERLFEIPVSRLLSVDGALREPGEVYRKVAPILLTAAELADDDANLGE